MSVLARKHILLSVAIVVGVLLFVSACSSPQGPSGKPPATSQAINSPLPTGQAMTNAKKSYSSPPLVTIDPNKQYTAVIETNKGKLTLELFAKDVPKTVNNFVFLARDGFYDSVIFHRVIPGFMAQGGDPTGTGTGGPGYVFDNEITSHKHVAGTLSMARTAQPNTNGSHFFITYAPAPHLDGGYSVFGQLTEGMDVLTKLVNGDVMLKVTIIEK